MDRIVSYLLCFWIVFLPGCTTNGPVSGAVLGGAAAVTAVFDQMLADDLIKPDQYIKLTKGFEAVQVTADAAKVASDAATKIASEAKNGAVSPETMAGGLSGTALAVLAAVRAWRGKAKKDVPQAA